MFEIKQSLKLDVRKRHDPKPETQWDSVLPMVDGVSTTGRMVADAGGVASAGGQWLPP